MTTSITTNISAQFAQNNLRAAGADAQTSIARLSSGNRIIRASDDVAALSIGTILRTDVSTLKTALSNTAQAASLIQVADGAIERLGEILQRQKALAVQGNADTLSNTERGYLDQEFQALISEYDRIVDETNFNGTALLDGNLTGAATAGTAASTGTIATGDITFNTPTDITAISVSSLGTDGDVGGAALDALFTTANIAAATVAITATPVVVGDFTLTDGTSTDFSNFSLDTLGTDSAVLTTANLAAITAADVVGVDGDTSTTTATLTITIGGVAFSSAAEAFNPAVGTDLTLTSAGGTAISFDYVGLGTTDATGSAAAVVAEIVGLTSVAPADDGGGDIAITIGGVVFSAPTDQVLAGDVAALVFTSDSANAETITINFDDLGATSDATLGTAQTAAETAVQALTYTNAFVFTATEGVTGSASFQVGTSATDTIAVDIANVDAATVGTATLDVGTKATAIVASAAIDTAIETLTSVRAGVGAAQSRFNFAASALEVSIQNIDSARSSFLDADISQESTAFAQNQVLIQASISVLAQANQLPQNLLKLIG